MYRSVKLKYLLVAVFISISAVPLFIGLQYLNSQSSGYLRQQTESKLAALSYIAKKRILTGVDRIKDNSALISSRTQMRLSLAKWNQFGGEVHRAKVTKIILDAAAGLSHLRDIQVYDAQGKLLTATRPKMASETLDPSRNQRPSITLLPKPDGLVAERREPLMLDKKTIGFIQLSFYTDFITELSQDRAGLGKSGEWLFAVRNKDGDALFVVPLKYNHSAIFVKSIPKERTDIPITQALLGNELVMHNAPDYRGEPVMASTRYISQLDWGLVAKMDEREVNSLATANRTVIYFAEGIIILFALLIGVALAFVIAKPIEKLTIHTSKVTQGFFEEHPPGNGWHEVKELTDNFNRMIKTLREFNVSLQTKVDERTRELNEANKKLEDLAAADPLTGLWNRRKFKEYLNTEFQRAQRYEHPLVLVMMDIDHFKTVNDTYGHAAGDQVLREIAIFLKKSVRTSDIAARLGGEEFCLILPQCTAQAAKSFLERVRIGISELEFTAEEKRFTVTCSFGFAVYDTNIDDPQTLLKQADTSLYQAKKEGRNRSVIFTKKNGSPDSHSS